MKKTFLISTILVCFGLLARGQTETEPNNSAGTANALAHDTDISGEIGSGCAVPDNSYDYFVITTPYQGMMTLRTSMSTDLPASTTATVQVLNSAQGVDAAISANVGGGGVPLDDSLQIYCQGAGLYYIRVHPTGAQCVNYTLSYEMTAPVFGADVEENDSWSVADTVHANLDHDGQIDFQYDDNADWYRLILPDDGVLNIDWQAEHADVSTTETLTVSLRQASVAVLQTWNVPIGANSVASAQTVSIPCRGNEQLYYLSVVSSVCGASYRFNYNVTSPVFADDLEENDAWSSANTDTVAVGVQAEGRIDFYYDDNSDYYILELDDDGVLNVHMEAEHAEASTTDSLTITLRQNSNAAIKTWRAPIGANSVPVLSDHQIECRGDEQRYFLDISSDICGVSYRFSYDIDAPVFADDLENNDAYNAVNTDTVPVNTWAEGRLDFYYDDNIDYYILELDDDGTLNFEIEAEHTSSSVSDSLTIWLYNNSVSVMTTWRAGIGASSIATNSTFSYECLGTEDRYFIRISSDECGASYRFRYTVSPAVFADDLENNDAYNAVNTDTVPVNTWAEGRLDFYYDDNIDYYILELDDDGTLNFEIEAEHTSSSVSDSLTIWLYDNSVSVITTWRAGIGASSIATNSTFSYECLGTENRYFIRISSDECGSSYRFRYNVTTAVFADDTEPNQSTGQAIVATAGTNYDGRLDFYYDDDYDYYRLQAPDDGVINVEFQAEHASASTTDSMEVWLRNSSGTTQQIFKVGIGANGVPNMQTLSRNCIGTEQVYYLEPYSPSACGVSYRFSYTVTSPVFADDAEPNQSTAQAIVANAGVDYDGRLDFDYDNDYDYYKLQAPNDGVLSVTVQAEHAGASATDSILVYLRNSSGSVQQIFKVGIGANSVPNTQVLTRNCFGTEDVYYLEPYSPDVCGVSYRLNYSVAAPVFADDTEPNQSTAQANAIDLEMAPVDGRLDFDYDNDYDYFVINHLGGPIVFDIMAESAGVAGTMDVDIRNSSNSFMELAVVTIGANGTPALTSHTSASYAAGTYYLEPNDPSVCGVSYQFQCYDDDNDGTCNFFDLCPGGPEPGTPCDDLNAATTNDVIQPDCSCAGTDCNGDIAGTAVVDDCGICAGGNTGLTPNADKDCNGDCFGTAAVDNCGVCAGGNTGLTPNADEDCNGDCFGTAVVDNCGVCAGGNTGLTPNADEDCNGDCFGTAAVDNCGVCAGGNTGLTPNADEDCNGDCFGTAAVDNCGVCAGGNTGLTPNADEDCNGDCFGTAVVDNCGVCAGGNTGLTPNADEDCEGTCFGTALPGTTCDDGNPNTINDLWDVNCVCMGTPVGTDCNGDIGGTALIDDCGVCAGGNTGLTPNADKDCNGDCFGTAAVDNCGVCAGGNTGLTPNADEDCNGDCFGTAAVDNCGVCAGGNTGLTPNADEDCNGDCFGTAVVDNCGVCAGGNTGLTPNADEDCNGDCFGTAAVDNCGVCAGGNTGLTPNADEDCNGDCFGTAVVDNCGVCAGGNTGLTPNADEDCEGTCFGTALPGTSCDDGDANTVNDMWTAGCSCVGTPIGGCTENLNLVIATDGAGNETSWQIIPHGGGAPLCSGGNYANNTTIVAPCCLPVGCYALEVFDSFGDGMTTGGYVLQDAMGERIIDNSLNGAGFTYTSAIFNGGGFCLPISNNRIIDNIANPAYGCDNLAYSTTDYFVAQPDPQVNSANGDGYQFWMFDPNGSYARRVFQTGSVNNGWSNADPNDACYLRFAWLQTNPVPTDLHLNIRVRVKVNGVYQAFGPACLALVQSTVNPCTTTRLVDDPNNPNYSCDVVLGFGVGDKVVAYPVAGANKYQFRFENTAEGYVRNIASSNNTRTLSWNTSPLQDGVTYDAKVRISFDNGANWCPWGPSCEVSIGTPPNAPGRDIVTVDNGATMVIWPNPHRDGPLNLTIEQLTSSNAEVQLDLFDKFGKRILSRTYPSSDGMLNTILELDDIASGVYVIHVVAGEDRFTETLVIQ